MASKGRKQGKRGEKDNILFQKGRLEGQDGSQGGRQDLEGEKECLA